jgi:protein-L-isoaspartate(D-aspartate) O-methyltransferase
MILPIGVGRAQKLYKVVKKGYTPALENLGEVLFPRIRGLFGFYDDYEDDVESRLSRLERQVKSILSRLEKKV